MRSDARFFCTEAWLYVDGIDVDGPVSTNSIVAFGDSITDGFVAATPLSEPVSLAVADKNGRYPDDLQRRLDATGIPLSVANGGIGSNRLVTLTAPLMLGLSGVHGFQEDALDVPGVRGVLLQEGINDLGLPPQSTTPADLIAGYEKVIAMAHADGVKIWLGTLLPASNAFFDGTITAPKSEIYREQVNDWIRTQQLADGVVDLTPRYATRPILGAEPGVLGPDHLHPNLAGYQVMANTVSLSMLRIGAVANSPPGHGSTAFSGAVRGGAQESTQGGRKSSRPRHVALCDKTDDPAAVGHRQPRTVVQAHVGDGVLHGDTGFERQHVAAVRQTPRGRTSRGSRPLATTLLTMSRLLTVPARLPSERHTGTDSSTCEAR